MLAVRELVFYGVLAAFSGAALGQASPGPCLKLLLPSPPTDKDKTFMRKGFGEYGAPRQGGESSHKGVDITRNMTDADPAATAVYAVAAGTVAYSRVNGSATEGYGNVVVIDHANGCYSMYAHLASEPFTPREPGGNLKVARGEKVTAGQQIGYFVDIKADTTSTGNAVRTDPAAREQMHFQLIEAPAGRSSAGALKDIIGNDGLVVDPTPLLRGLGYTLR